MWISNLRTRLKPTAQLTCRCLYVTVASFRNWFFKTPVPHPTRRKVPKHLSAAHKPPFSSQYRAHLYLYWTETQFESRRDSGYSEKKILCFPCLFKYFKGSPPSKLFTYSLFMITFPSKLHKLNRQIRVEMTVFWIVAPCSIVESGRTFQRCLLPSELFPHLSVITTQWPALFTPAVFIANSFLFRGY